MTTDTPEHPCPQCEGTGLEIIRCRKYGGSIQIDEPCFDCAGTGTDPNYEENE